MLGTNQSKRPSQFPAASPAFPFLTSDAAFFTCILSYCRTHHFLSSILFHLYLVLFSNTPFSFIHPFSLVSCLIVEHTIFFHPSFFTCILSYCRTHHFLSSILFHLYLVLLSNTPFSFIHPFSLVSCLLVEHTIFFHPSFFTCILSSCRTHHFLSSSLLHLYLVFLSNTPFSFIHPLFNFAKFY